MLQETLNALEQALANFQSNVEVIVVNNNSTDHTDEVISSAKQHIPVHRVYEPKPGLSNARNAAVRSVSGDYIIWTDDDVIVHPKWLAAYERAFQKYPNNSFFGGPIFPKFEASPPQWLTHTWDQIPDVFALLDQGSSYFQILDVKHLPYGANYAIRTDIQRSYEYDPTLGRQQTGVILVGEETSVLQSLLTDGHCGWWVPDASVEHKIPKYRMTMRYIIQHGFGQGCTVERIRPESFGPSRLLFFGSPLSKWKICLCIVIKAIITRFKKTPKKWVPKIHQASVHAGKLYEAARRR